MRAFIVVMLGLALLATGWGLAGAVESKQEPQAAALPAGTVVKDAAAKPDPAAEKKARDEAAKKAQDYARTRRTLASPRPSFEFENMPIKDILTYMSEVGKFSVVYDKALEEAGIVLSTRSITIRLARMTYETALNL
ncbi:MAG: hypothetical protein NT049_07285, partial [Planctomycetota bacterium]|nr:hypothetical protein [Planctomycetota bacterium]